MDRIEDIRLFLRVLDLGSISAAARTLDLSPAVASQRLKRLEEALGVRLLQRSTRQLKLTPEGEALAERGRPLIEDLEALAGDLRRSAEEVSGTLRVTLPAAFGRLYISPLMPEFLARHPRLRLSLDMRDAMLDLVAEGIDVGLRIGTLDDSSVVARRLSDNRRLLCAAPAYLARRGTPRTPAELEQHDCLLMVGAKGPRDRWTLTAPDGSETTVRVRGPLESNMGEVIHDATLAGLGIALFSTWHVCEDLRAGRLRQVLPEYRLPESGIYAVMPQRRLMLPRVRAFIDFVVEKLGDVPPWER
ncbi:MAG TPA: LysR family transcriptional regulator [Woeseiaceae bacterium]|nr:LysR family transcriptional regulator [Woeseiaceae bacterium]